MTDEQKQAIKNLRSQGYTMAKIADMLGMKTGTVKSFCLRENRKEALCRNCRKPLEQLPGCKPKTFCGDACRLVWWKNHRDQMNHTIIYRYQCAHCNQAFDSVNKGRKYCSHLCYITARFGVP